MSDTKGMANITDHDSDLTCRIKDDRDLNIVNIEHIFEQMYIQQFCIINGLKKLDCKLSSLSKRESRCSRSGRIYCYRQRYSYIDGVFIDYPDDETFWNAKYGKYHYHDRTKEQIFQRFADLYLL
jgi:hypothetical protein